jgi:2-iminobutanoate/2-iminopropanoate deaminase
VGFWRVVRQRKPQAGHAEGVEHIQKLLAQKNLTFRDVVKTTVLINPIAYFEVYNELYAEYFQPPYPCRTTIPTPSDQCFLEIDIVAYKKGLSDS